MSRLKVLVTGCRGQLGSDLVKILGNKYEVSGVDIDDFDICDYENVHACFKKFQPDFVLHTAAYTNVDACEEKTEMALSINATGTENIARVCKNIHARMVYYSTDYVFNGKKSTPYVETDQPDPQTVYGKSKLEGERRMMDILDGAVTLRLAWVYGFRGKNFVRTMIKLGWEQIWAAQKGDLVKPLKIVDDQIGNPSWTVDIAHQTQAVLENNLKGIYHTTSEGKTSWYNLARRIFEIMEMPVQIQPCGSNQYPGPAPRPKWSVLENKRLKDAGLNIMPDWVEALKKFLNQQGKQYNNEM